MGTFPGNPNYYFAVTELIELAIGTTVNVIAVTDVPCHLWLRWSANPPQAHTVPVFLRGTALNTERYFCFTAYQDVEQNQPGDTIAHTFIVTGWPQSVERWYYFWGTVTGQVARSTTAPYSYRNADPPAPIISLTLSALARRDPTPAPQTSLDLFILVNGRWFNDQDEFNPAVTNPWPGGLLVTPTWLPYSKTYPVNPISGAPWQHADLLALQPGAAARRAWPPDFHIRSFVTGARLTALTTAGPLIMQPSAQGSWSGLDIRPPTLPAPHWAIQVAGLANPHTNTLFSESEPGFAYDTYLFALPAP